MQMYEAGQIYDLPDANGHFGPYGGVFVAETLMHALDELRREYLRVREDASFQAEFDYELKHYVGRPSPVYHAKRLSEQLGGAQIWLKREDLNHTGAHKINNTVGQALVARRMGKRRVIAETGAGQHGVASATVAARYGMECVVYMGSEDIKRQAMNVYRMKLLGATVVPVESGSKTLEGRAQRSHARLGDQRREHLLHHRHGSRAASLSDDGARFQLGGGQGAARADAGDDRPAARRDPRLRRWRAATPWACSIPISRTPTVQLIGVEAAGEGIATGHHAATLCAGRPGVLHGNRTYLLQDEDGQIIETHSISAGLDYPGVGPEHSWLKDSGRAQYVAATDEEALHAFHTLCRTEGIMPALESSHALAHAMKIAPGMGKDKVLLVNLSGRGDKDMHTVAKHSGITL